MTAPFAPPRAETLAGELRSLMALAWPLIGSNLVISLMNFIDVVMAGRLSGADLAAVGVGSSMWLLCFLGVQGVLTALTPIVAQHHGAGQLDQVMAYLWRGARLALALGCCIVLVAQLGAGPLLSWIGIDPAFRALAVAFVKAIAWGAPAICVFLVLRFVLEGLGHTRPIFYISLAALLFNIAGNVIFMYGYLGVTPMGGVGAGLASALSMWVMLLLAVTYFVRSGRMRALRPAAATAVPAGIESNIVKLGLPIAGTVLAEHGFFIVVTLLMGTISVNAAAAHQIAINYTSVMYMIPMALASAVSIRVAHCAGAGDGRQACRQGMLGIAVCVGFMLASAIVLLLLRRQVAQVYSADPALIDMTAALLLVAAAFQVSDGLQVGISGVLRGLKDTRVPFLISVMSYWAIGLPLAWQASRAGAARPDHVWWSFVIGLTVSALLLLIRFALTVRRLAPPAYAVLAGHRSAR